MIKKKLMRKKIERKNMTNKKKRKIWIEWKKKKEMNKSRSKKLKKDEKIYFFKFIFCTVMFSFHSGKNIENWRKKKEI